MIALSIRQPWAWLILNAGKDIENRDWKTPFRGRCLIHASKSGTKHDYDEAIDFLNARHLDHLGVNFPSFDQLEKGGIVGMVDIVGCTDTSDSPWFVGDYGFILRNPKPLPFTPYKGRLGFFNVPEIKP
ncbi:MAG: ASCH domain-containing protein [Ferribacterium limneticum]